ncbi:MAG: 2'-deoxycytidine 5'-triphosphate deaminase [Patescibacteria group bacterium]
MNSRNSEKKGALPSQSILELISAGFIKGAKEANVRPSSLDLSISDEIYSVEGIFQPKKNETVRQVLDIIKKKKHSLTKPLERDCMYMIRLNETMELPESVYGFCNPKSTSGRIDAHVRLIADGVSRYDSVNPGWKGELWISIVPKTFPIKLYEGVSLNQLRFFNEDKRLNDAELEIAMKKYKLLWRQRDNTPYEYSDLKVRDQDSSVILTLDLAGEILGYEGVVSDNVVDLEKINFYDYKKFFKPIKKKGNYVYLKKNAFYILSTHEAIRVPPELACEMVPMDERSGEFRSHYAGFIDPGWGWGMEGEGKGRPLTLEVRPFEDLIVRQGQPIGKIKFEKITENPDLPYDAYNSNYIKQTGPKLAKHFKQK